MKRIMTAAVIALAMLFGASALLQAEDAQGPLTNSTGKTVIKRISTDRSLGTSFLIISKSGTTIILDPYRVSKDIDPSKVDAVFITHSHRDHQDMAFQRAVNTAGGKVVRSEPGEFKIKDVVISGIPSSHDSDEIMKPWPNNVLYLVQVDGLRIVHMGDIGQNTLNPEQMKALGKIDIAFMQFDNGYSNMSVENGKGFKLIEQLGPQVVIPTHVSVEAKKKLADIYGGTVLFQDVWTVIPEDLSDGKKKAIDLM